MAGFFWNFIGRPHLALGINLAFLWDSIKEANSFSFPGYLRFRFGFT